MFREPFVAGKFYPGGREQLERKLESCLSPQQKKTGFVGALVPHAGYEFSGKTAGGVYSRIKLPPAVVVLGPKHTGEGRSGAVWAAGAWRTPLGDMEVSAKIAMRLINGCRLLEEDYAAHRFEHSIEVQVPFLQYSGGASFVPAALGLFSYENCREIAECLANVLGEQDEDVSIIASSDMTHFEPEDSAREKDGRAIEAMQAMDERALFDAVREENISMCGLIPAVIMIAAVKKLGAKKAELTGYATSAPVTGDYSDVVGYCGMVFR